MAGRRTAIAGFLLAPCAAWAQAGPAGRRRPRLAILMPYPAGDAVVRRRVAAFREALAGLGWTEGATIEILERWTGDDLGHIRATAAEVLAGGVDIMLTTGSRVVRILRDATQTVPVVFVGTSDPVGQGLIPSLTRPGGNITGFAQLELDGGTSPLIGKQVELLRELVPGLARLTLLFNPDNPASAAHRRSFETVTASGGITARLAPVHRGAEIEAAVREAAAEPGHGAMLLPSDLTLLGRRAAVVAALARHRLPAIFSDEAFVEAGGLVAYSADRTDLFRRAAGYVDRILRGEKPGDLPIQLPTAYAMAVNLQTARALGVEVPPALLGRAEMVID